MGNVYLNLPCPSANGAGAWVDVSAQGAEKTIVVGGDPRGTINIEISNETGAPTEDGAVVATFLCMGGGGKQTVVNAAMWMRAVMSDYKSGTPQVDSGANDDGAAVANLPATAGTGTGAGVDVSLLGGVFKTVVVTGTYRGTVVIEISEDNVQWAQAMVFTSSPRFQSKVVTAKYMRVRRVGVPTIAPGLPQVDVAVITDVTPGPGFNDPELVTYVADGTEGAETIVPISTRATFTYYVACMSQSQVANVSKLVTLIAGKGVSSFRAYFSAPLDAGDTFEFLVVG